MKGSFTKGLGIRDARLDNEGRARNAYIFSPQLLQRCSATTGHLTRLYSMHSQAEQLMTVEYCNKTRRTGSI